MRQRLSLALIPLAALGIVLLLLLLYPQGDAFSQGSTVSQGSAPKESCDLCHYTRGLTFSLPSGETLNLYVDAQALASSIHGGKLTCSDCHFNYVSYPHPTRKVQSRREYSIAQYEVCKRCHFPEYTKTLDSEHFQALAGGNPKAPVCTDCHGFHDIGHPREPKPKISQTCSSCHSSIYQEYVDSVHGKALIKEGNGDTPVCTDCHGIHNIHDPRTPTYRQQTPNLCAKCHTDKKLMDRYGISTNVVGTYLQDFHGVSVALIQKQSPDIWVYQAVCTDCHGVHNIVKVDDPSSPVVRANLLQTCRKCHPDATENFPGSWLSHYDPSPSKAPLVFFARLFYSILIPFMVVGLSIHVLTGLWRAATKR